MDVLRRDASVHDRERDRRRLAADDSETIKNVMKVAMKGALAKTVYTGKATAKQKEELLELFKDLAKAKPPKGTEKDWKKKTGALVDAARDQVDGKSGAEPQIKKAANCKACHDAHRGKGQVSRL